VSNDKLIERLEAEREDHRRMGSELRCAFDASAYDDAIAALRRQTWRPISEGSAVCAFRRGVSAGL